ncbi:Uncharacterised protein [Halioglobus japonicus]|nr:Uncharacterised protein [Halioglobus japonicus]
MFDTIIWLGQARKVENNNMQDTERSAKRLSSFPFKSWVVPHSWALAVGFGIRLGNASSALIMRQLKSLSVVFAACICAVMSQATAAQGILQSFFPLGEEIVKDQPYYSEDKKYFAVHQKDNNLVVHETEGGTFIWGLNEDIGDSYASVARILLGADGMLIGLDENYNEVWAPPGIVIIDRMALPVVTPIPAGTYKTLVKPYGWTEPQMSGGRVRGIVWEANKLIVGGDGAFEIASYFETLSSGTLEQYGEQICTNSDLSYALSGRGTEGDGGCFAFSDDILDTVKGSPHSSLGNCLSLSSEERNQLIILCP